HRLFGRRQQMLHRAAFLSVDQLVAVRDLHAAGFFRLDLGRALVGADQRYVGGSSHRAAVSKPLLIGEPQTAGNHPRQHYLNHPPNPDSATPRGVRPSTTFLWAGIGCAGPIHPRGAKLIRHDHISCAGSTPNTASPEAMTTATPRTSAKRACVNCASEARIN